MPGTRKLGRTTDHRKAMLRGMVTYLLENGRVETTVTRAKEVRAMAEKMITVAKDNTLHAKRQAFAYITKDSVVKKLFDEIAPKYAGVNGGYTRIVKTGTRRGDAAEMCIIELVTKEEEAPAKKPARRTRRTSAKPAAKAEEKAAPKAEEKAEAKAEEAKPAEAAEAAEAKAEEAAEAKAEEAPAEEAKAEDAAE